MNFPLNRVNIADYFKNLLKNRKGGVALVLVIWAMVMLTAIAGEFTYSMRTELNIVRNLKEEEESYQSALAGIELAKLEILSAKKSSYVYMNEDGILVLLQENENPVRTFELENGSFSYTINDEDGKLNINNATLPQLKYIVRNTGIDDIAAVDTIVDSIIDWKDTNDLHMLNGAEEDYYQSLENPYSCKDGSFDIIDELLLVKGVTPEIFYGSEKKDDEEEETDESESDEKQSLKGIAQYFTPFARGNININTAPELVLEAVFGIEAAQNIIIQRKAGPVLTGVGGGSLTSFVFTVISTGTARDGKIKRTIKTTLKKRGMKLEVIYWNDNFIG